MTTLVMLDGGTLWENLTANLLLPQQLISGDCNLQKDEDVFPWFAPSQKEKIGADDVHPLHVYWAMPRKIKLEFEKTKGKKQKCDLCGAKSEVFVSQYKSLSGGNQYVESTFRHPFTAYVKNKDGNFQTVRSKAAAFHYTKYLDRIGENPEIEPPLTLKYLDENRFPLKNYLTVEEISKIMKVSDTVIKKWARKDLKPQSLAIKSGQSWMIHKSAIPLFAKRSGPGRPKKSKK